MHLKGFFIDTLSKRKGSLHLFQFSLLQQSILKVSKNQLLRLRQEYNLIFLLAIHKGSTKKKKCILKIHHWSSAILFAILGGRGTLQKGRKYTKYVCLLYLECLSAANHNLWKPLTTLYPLDSSKEHVANTPLRPLEVYYWVLQKLSKKLLWIVLSLKHPTKTLPFEKLQFCTCLN